MQGRNRLCVLLVVATWTILCFQPSQSKGFIDVKLRTYRHGCEEDLGTNDCDPMFTFCLSRPKNKVSWKKSFCKYGYKKSSHFQNDDFINFQTVSDKEGVPVPWVLPFDKIDDTGKQPKKGELMLSIRIYDHDTNFLWGSHDHMTNLYQNVSVTINSSNNDNAYKSYTINKSYHEFKFDIRLYCAENYYSDDCETFCETDSTDNYFCHPTTGEKICKKGWTGNNCEIDINECALGYCKHGTCENQPGDYECNCDVFYTGKNCSINNNPCANGVCKNDATCLVDPKDLSFQCVCTEGWTGILCDHRIDLCTSSPCQNGGSCIASVDKLSFSCSCPNSHIGEFCHISTTTETTTTSSTTMPTTIAPTTTTTTTTMPTTTTTQSTTTTTMATPVPTTTDEIAQGGGVGQSKAGQNAAAAFHLWYIVFIILAVVLVVILLYFIMRKRKDGKLRFASQGLPPPSSAIIVYDQQNEHLAFENTMYTETNATNMEVERSQGQGLPPIPSRPPSDELFYPTKPPKSSEYEEPSVGAQGVTYDNSCAKGKPFDTDSTDTKSAGVTNLRRTPTERAESNPYQDFKALTFKREKDVEVNDEKIEMQPDEDDMYKDDEEDHYQELDELAMRTDRTPTVTIDSRDSIPPPFVPPPRIQSLVPREIAPALPTRKTDHETETTVKLPSTVEYADPEEENDYDDYTHPYAEVNKSRHSSDTLPLRGSHRSQDGHASLVSTDSGYDIPSGIGPRSGTSNQDPIIYDNPKNNGSTQELDASTEYNIPSSSSVNGEVKAPVGLAVTNDPWTPDPFSSMNDEEDDYSDDNEPEIIKDLKNEVKNDLNFVLLEQQPVDSKV